MGAPQCVVVGGGGPSADAAALQALEQVVRSSPTGMTPLCAALASVVSEIRNHAPALRAASQHVTLIVASDGAASDGNVSAALRPLVGMPCNVVIRLCTNDTRVAEYWGGIDADLELELDVLDDVASEGAEVHKANPWLAYAEPLHRLREWGGLPKVFDLLDEKSLAPNEASEVVRHILGPTAADMPNPQASFLLLDPLGIVPASV